MNHSTGLRVIFAGTPEFSMHHLNALVQSRHQVIAVYTQPDRPAGRGKKLTASPVKKLAQEHEIPIYQPTSLKDETEQQKLVSLQADIMVVVAYGLILPKTILEAPKYGCINVHASLLPRWRGAAPIQRAIAAGDTHTGVTIMQMDEGLDTGDMLLKTECPIHKNDNAGIVHDRLIEAGCESLIHALEGIQSGTILGTRQDDSLSNYAPKISKDDARIDWTQSAEEIDCLIRAFNPFPVTHTQLDDKTIRIWQAHPLPDSQASSILTDADTDISGVKPGTIVKSESQGIIVACGKGHLVISQMQLPGKKALPVSTILNGYQHLFASGKQLGQ